MSDSDGRHDRDVVLPPGPSRWAIVGSALVTVMGLVSFTFSTRSGIFWTIAGGLGLCLALFSHRGRSNARQGANPFTMPLLIIGGVAGALAVAVVGLLVAAVVGFGGNGSELGFLVLLVPMLGVMLWALTIGLKRMRAWSPDNPRGDFRK